MKFKISLNVKIFVSGFEIITFAQHDLYYSEKNFKK